MNHLLRTHRISIFALVLAMALSMATGCGRGPAPASPAAAGSPSGVLSGRASSNAPAAAPAWIATSNQHTEYALGVLAPFMPERPSDLGMEALDEEIMDLGPGYVARTQAAYRELLAGLARRLDAETDPLVRQDLHILIQGTERRLRASELDQAHLLPYLDVPGLVFYGLESLLDEQVAPARRGAALVRLRKYTGMEPGVTPVVELAMAHMREAFARPGLLGPARDELLRDLDSIPFFLDGLGALFDKHGIAGYQEPMVRLKQQLGAYEAFVRAELLPRARTDFRLPPALYAFALEDFGIDIPPAELAAQARVAFDQIQGEMQTIATELARQRGWPDADYRAVIRRLKQEQLVGEAILPHYQDVLARIEDIIRREDLVTMPARPVIIRLATEAESAQQPAPNMRGPRLLNNQGERGEFLLPLGIPARDPAKAKQYDDFTFAAAAWTLTAHEARPGHELQFATMVERGVSLARVLFAFNSVNVEGWALYAEHVMKPHMPLEGQLVSLQARLLRAARAFCDPALQEGSMTPDQVKALLMTDVVQSDAMATQEVERYTFRAPGQAGSYFYGYSRLLALRAEVEARLGEGFDPKAFHDFVLAQGLLPPDLLRKAVLEDFAAGQVSARLPPG